MIDYSAKDMGVLMVLTERFMKRTLPRLKLLKEKVAQGNNLSDVDIDFLEDIMANANQNMPAMDAHPELHEFCEHVVHLYKEITAQALDNEQKNS